MFDEVKAYLASPELFVDGEWQLHYGDGAMFGPSFDLAYWRLTDNTDHYDRGIASLDANQKRVEAAAADPLDEPPGV